MSSRKENGEEEKEDPMAEKIAKERNIGQKNTKRRSDEGKQVEEGETENEEDSQKLELTEETEGTKGGDEEEEKTMEDEEENEKMREEWGEMLRKSREKVTEKQEKRGVTESGPTGREGEIIERAEKRRRIGKAIQKEKENREKGNRKRKTTGKSPKVSTFKWEPKLALKR